MSSSSSDEDAFRRRRADCHGKCAASLRRDDGHAVVGFISSAVAMRTAA